MKSKDITVIFPKGEDENVHIVLCHSVGNGGHKLNF